MKATTSILLGALPALALTVMACARTDVAEHSPTTGGTDMAIRITSPAFAPGSSIPARHTCDDEDLSPPLEWTGVPEGAKSIALVCDDPDAPAGNWVHWVLHSIPATVAELPEGVPAKDTVVGGARQGVNDFKRIGYGGPCPPRGAPHRYFFRLYALDQIPVLPPRASRAQLLEAMKGHVLAEGELMGTYQRK